MIRADFAKRSQTCSEILLKRMMRMMPRHGMLAVAPEEAAHGNIPIRPFGLLTGHELAGIACGYLNELAKTCAHQFGSSAHGSGIELHFRRAGIVVEGQRLIVAGAIFRKVEVLAGDFQRMAGKHRIDFTQRISAQRLRISRHEIGKRAGGRNGNHIILRADDTIRPDGQR